MELDRASQPIILHRELFEEVGHRRYKVAAVISRAWCEAGHLAELPIPMTPSERSHRHHDRLESITLNFTDLMAGMRELERGEHHMMLLGKTAWDIVADINNESLAASDAEYLIPWIDGVHPDFRNGAHRREQAAQHLADAYRQLRLATPA